MKGVQEPSRDSGGNSRLGSSLGCDPYCGNENIGCLESLEVSGICWAGSV